MRPTVVATRLFALVSDLTLAARGYRELVVAVVAVVRCGNGDGGGGGGSSDEGGSFRSECAAIARPLD
jgi:uncharacterized membrane protein YgcG